MIVSGFGLFVIYVLGCHRLTRLTTTDTISAPMREGLRARAYGRQAGTLDPVVISRQFAWLHSLVTCNWCSSIWVAIGMACGWKYQPGQWFNLFAAAMAASSGTGLISDRLG